MGSNDVRYRVDAALSGGSFVLLLRIRLRRSRSSGFRGRRLSVTASLASEVIRPHTSRGFRHRERGGNWSRPSRRGCGTVRHPLQVQCQCFLRQHEWPLNRISDIPKLKLARVFKPNTRSVFIGKQLVIRMQEPERAAHDHPTRSIDELLEFDSADRFYVWASVLPVAMFHVSVWPKREYVAGSRRINAEDKPVFDDLFVRTGHYARSGKPFFRRNPMAKIRDAEDFDRFALAEMEHGGGPVTRRKMNRSWMESSPGNSSWELRSAFL